MKAWEDKKDREDQKGKVSKCKIKLQLDHLYGVGNGAEPSLLHITHLSAPVHRFIESVSKFLSKHNINNTV